MRRNRILGPIGRNPTQSSALARRSSADRSWLADWPHLLGVPVPGLPLPETLATGPLLPDDMGQHARTAERGASTRSAISQRSGRSGLLRVIVGGKCPGKPAGVC